MDRGVTSQGSEDEDWRVEVMEKRQPQDESVLHDEIVALKKRIEVLEARVTELERELRETQETAPLD